MKKIIETSDTDTAKAALNAIASMLPGLANTVQWVQVQSDLVAAIAAGTAATVEFGIDPIAIVNGDKPDGKAPHVAVLVIQVTGEWSQDVELRFVAEAGAGWSLGIPAELAEAARNPMYDGEDFAVVSAVEALRALTRNEKFRRIMITASTTFAYAEATGMKNA